MAPTPESFEPGALVVCADARLAAASGVEGRVGIVAEARKRDARALYFDPERSAWLPNASLRLATSEESTASPLAVVSGLFRKLGGKELELQPGPEGSLRMIIGHGAVTPALIDEIRAALGPRLAAWRLRPAGLSKIQSLIEVSGPAP